MTYNKAERKDQQGLFHWLKKIFAYPPCPKCGGEIKFIGWEDNMNIYECQSCKEWFI